MAGNIVAGAAARLLSAGLGLALLIIMAHGWGRARLGLYAIGFTWYQLLQLTPLLGLHFLLARDVAAGRVPAARLLVTIGSLALAASVPMAAALALAGALQGGDLAMILGLVGLALIPGAAIATIEMLLTGQERLGRLARVTIAEAALRCLVFGAMVLAGFGPDAVFIAFVALRLLALALHLGDRRVRALLRPGAFDRSLLRAYLREVPVLGMSLLAAVGAARLDVAVLAMLVVAEQVAVYSVAARLYELALMVPTVLMSALLPVVARIGPDRREALEALCALLTRYGVIIGVVAALVGGALLGPAIVAVFGRDFAGAAAPLRLLLFASVAVAGNQMFAGVLLVFGLQRLDLLCIGVGCALLVGMLVLLVPPFGIIGAAAAVLGAAAVQCVGRIVIVGRRTGLVLRPRTLLRPPGRGDLSVARSLLAARA